MENRKYLEKQIERISLEVGKICYQKPWSSGMGYIMSLPGFGMITAMTVLAAIGEIERFETPKKLASYSGLTPGLEQSGTKNRGKGITKEGRRELRWALVEAALQAVKSDPLLKRRFDELQKRIHRNQAIVSIARHLLELVWYVLTRRQPYRGFTQERIAYKYLTWAWQMKDTERDGLTRVNNSRDITSCGLGSDMI
jgi:transposase